MDQQLPVNGAGALDLAAVKAQALAHQQLEADRPRLILQLLAQAGLVCQCGQPMTGQPIIYFVPQEGPVQTPQGPQLGLNLTVHACCSRSCPAAGEIEKVAVARRQGPNGPVRLLNEGRTAVDGARAVAHAIAQHG